MNTDEEIENLIAALPDALLPKIKLSQPNQTVKIYQGKFDLLLKNETITVAGEINFSWKPDSRVAFTGTTPFALLLLKNEIEKIQIPGQDVEHGSLQILNTSDEQITGIISAPFVIKYSTKAVDRIYFELPNFKNTFGLPIKKIDHDRRHFSSARLEWSDKSHSFIIDKLFEFEKIYSTLKAEGGYALTHSGKISLKFGTMTHQQSRVIAEKLGLFLSFIKGRRNYPHFLHGFNGDQLCWIDYSAFYVDRHLDVDSWLPQSDYTDIPALWNGFLAQTQNADDYQCVDYLIHWYIEANNNSGFVEGSIVLLQNAFELLYNWRIKTKTKLAADEKIRKLIQQAQMPLDFHQDYNEMLQTLKSKKIHFNDFPKLFTMIRNAIVHSDYQKRTQLSKYPGLYRFYIKHIGLYHLELLLLNLFGYNGKIASRLPMERYAGGNEQYVPWSIRQNNVP